MPIYEYQCGGCQAVHEVVQKFSDAPMANCPSCGGEVKKLISLSAFHLKGTGWYNTDYKGKKGEPAAPPVKPTNVSEPAAPAKETSVQPAAAPAIAEAPKPKAS